MLFKSSTMHKSQGVLGMSLTWFQEYLSGDPGQFVMMVGHRSGYKGGQALFDEFAASARLRVRSTLLIVAIVCMNVNACIVAADALSV